MSRHIIPIVFFALVLGGGAYFLFGRDAPPEETTAKEEHRKEAGHIEISAERIAKAGIKTESVGPATIRETVSLYGVITANAERTRDVAVRFPGVVRRLAKSLGDAVSQGETLAMVESNESLQTYPVAAPIGGVVTARNANPGEQTGDKVLFTISDLSSVWVELSLFPRDAAKVQVGQAARIKNAETGLTNEGKLVYIAPLSSAANQTRNARVLLENADGRWTPGLYVTAEVILGEKPVSLAIRNEALQDVEGSESVFVQNAEGFEIRTLKLGRRDSDHTEVVEGLKSGERYATGNSFILKAERGKSELSDEH